MLVSHNLVVMNNYVCDTVIFKLGQYLGSFYSTLQTEEASHQCLEGQLGQLLDK